MPSPIITIIATTVASLVDVLAGIAAGTVTPETAAELWTQLVLKADQTKKQLDAAAGAAGR